MPNRLAREQSPYLLQHRDNPVDWYSWGDEAFARARAEQKPIFLSIGYSTCHWCHVMAHESFEDAAIAERLNADFVSIKLDREERPDVDRVYMTFVQAVTGSGGWPMSVWLTPDLRPFYGGTYFPPTSRRGRPGFLEVLTEIARAWRDERTRVVSSAGRLFEQLQVVTRPTVPDADGADAGVPLASLEATVGEFRATFDQIRGGFGQAPKFPRPSELLFLLREHVRTGSGEALAMVTATLRAMVRGGMHDQVGGGFHRYSVDAGWRVPHFEKMLYDQAQILLALTEATALTGEDELREAALGILDYVARDLTHADGGFLAAEDADSVPPDRADDPTAHATEGAFYLWTADELRARLGDDAEVVAGYFGVRADGNAPEDPHGDFEGRNILYRATAGDPGVSRAVSPAAVIDRARARLFEWRTHRPRPSLDDKVLTSWNGLMIAACARASWLLPDDGALTMARRAATFVESRLWDPVAGRLSRRERQGHVAGEGGASDYAALIWGLLELFQADGDPHWLEWALQLQARQDALFLDRDGGGWFETSGEDASVLLRLKEDYDGAEPSASAIAVLNLLVLDHLIGSGEVDPRLDAAFRMFGPQLSRLGRRAPLLLAGRSMLAAGLRQVVVTGAPGDPTRLAFDAALRQRWSPFTIRIPVVPAHRDRLAERLPWTADMGRDGAAAAYVCRAFTCLAPARSADDLSAQLA